MRKTKKQKLQAEIRRQKNLTSQQILDQPIVNQVPEVNQVNVNINDIIEKVKTDTSAEKALAKAVIEGDDYSYVFSDLKKIAVLSFLAITIQIVLYLTLL